jgi:putative DNA methylase
MAGALEEDARLTALFLWTLQSSNGNGGEQAETEPDYEPEEGEDEEEIPRGKTKGFSLIFDVVRRFAQPLGIHLPGWEERIIKTDKGIVRLLPISERAKQLFGEDEAEFITENFEHSSKAIPQLSLFSDRGESVSVKGKRHSEESRSAVPKHSIGTRHEATTLDRVHAAMLLQKSGRANALRNLLKAEQDRGPDFLRLANALSALYPKDTEEKRLLDAMLLAVPR